MWWPRGLHLYHTFYREHALACPNLSSRTCGGPEVFTSTTLFTGSMPLPAPTSVLGHVVAPRSSPLPHFLQGACPCLPQPQFKDMWWPRGLHLYHTFYREHALACPNLSSRTCGGPESFISTTIFMKCDGRTSLGLQERCILKTHWE